MAKRRKLPHHVDKRFRTKKAALAYQRKVDRAGRVATAPYKVRGGYIVRSTRHKVFLKRNLGSDEHRARAGRHEARSRRLATSFLRKPKGSGEAQIDYSNMMYESGKAAAHKESVTAKNRRKTIKRNRGKRLSDADMEELMREPGFKKALKLYRKIHGCDPESISRVILPIGGKRVTGREFFASMGKAPAESYEPYQKGSRKRGKIWVHPYDHKPEKVVSADGKTIITLPGSHGVRDIDGEAWIDG